MKKLKLILLFAILFFQNLSNARPSYSDDDLTQFNEKNSCLKCDLSGANLYGLRHDGAILSESNLNETKFEWCKFRKSNFVSSILIRASDYQSDYTQSDFSNARMDYISMSYSHFSGAIFINTNLQSAKLYNVNLSSTDFTGANTKGVDFGHSILIGSNITKDQLTVAKSLSCAVLPDGTVNPADKYDRCN